MRAWLRMCVKPMFRHAMCRISDAQVCALRQTYLLTHGDFLLPPDYAQHKHNWVAVAMGVQICKLCGVQHVCFRGECDEVENKEGEKICVLTGCVTTFYSMKEERDACTRTCMLTNEPQPKQQTSGSKIRKCGVEQLHNNVRHVISELLVSDKALHCAREERERWQSKASAVLNRLLRNASCEGGKRGVNLIDIEARLCHIFRRMRNQRAVTLARQRIKQTIDVCVENIVRVIVKYGWFRVRRQMKQGSRAREFICSLLYLMRTGITYQCRCILPRVEDLNVLLPLQVFLYRIFKIRPKCITEGENIIKLDTRRFTLE